MKALYSFDDVKRAVPIDRYLMDRGNPPQGDRFRAVWRGGDGLTCSFTAENGVGVWCDHKAEEGGSVIDLCMRMENLDERAAVRTLAERYGVKPAVEVKRRKDAPRLVAQYDYRDADGKVVHFTRRYEPKAFSQGTPDNPFSIDGVETVLYRLPEVLAASTVYVAEGEKDAETLVSFGLCGTTSPMGAKKWKPQYTEALRGKDVWIVPDNDGEGRKHEQIVRDALKSAARSIHVLRVPAPFKDITEWAEAGNGAMDFLGLVDADPAESVGRPLTDEERRHDAKEANKRPFSNTRRELVHEEGRKAKWQDVPIPIHELIEDVRLRFLSFPRKVGDHELFDHDFDTDEIVFLEGAHSLEAWIARKSKNLVKFGRGCGTVSMSVLFEGLMQSAIRYDAIASVPFFPRRKGVYLRSRENYAPSPRHEAFDRLVGMFSPADEPSRILLRSLIATPIWFAPKIQRPFWVVDSADGHGAGKTTLVDIVAHLYDCTPIKTSQYQLRFDFDELLKNILSSSGRLSRVLLVDNVAGDFDEPRFASLVTDPDFSGRPSYGHGVETRANDLTCFVTVNNAQLSSEIADRAFTVMLRHPVAGPSLWKKEVVSYVDANRAAILGDIIDILSASRNPDFEGIRFATRTAEYEDAVLRPMCGTVENLRVAMDGIMAQRQNADIERDAARTVEECVAFMLKPLLDNCAPLQGSTVDDNVIFIRSEVMDGWLSSHRIASVAKLRSYIVSGLATHFINGVDRFPNHNPHIPQRRGFMWVGSRVTRSVFEGRVVIVGRTGASARDVAVLDPSTIAGPGLADMIPEEPREPLIADNSAQLEELLQVPF